MTTRVVLSDNMSYAQGYTTKAVLYVNEHKRYQMECEGPLMALRGEEKCKGAALRGATTAPLLSEFAASVQWLQGEGETRDWADVIQDTYAVYLKDAPLLKATLTTLQALVKIYSRPRTEKLIGVKFYSENGDDVVDIPSFSEQKKQVKRAEELVRIEKMRAQHAAEMLEFEKNRAAQDAGRVEADGRAKLLFAKTFPGLDPTSNPKFESKKLPGVVYTIDSSAELFARHGLITVSRNGVKQGQLCCVVDSTRDNTPGTDVLLQKCLLLRYDEFEIWKYSNWFTDKRVYRPEVVVDPKSKMPKLRSGTFYVDTGAWTYGVA